jgi:hypothetical protein
MNSLKKYLVKLILLSNFIAVFSSFGATIPIAVGNTWEYQHSYVSYDNNAETGEKFGSYIISIDSISIRGDSILFKVSTIDSGQGYYRSFGLWMPGSFYDLNTNNYLFTKNLLFTKDTATGLWKTYGESFLSYSVQPDSSYHVTEKPSYYDTVDYQRNTDSAAVIVNGKDTGTLYTTSSNYTYASGPAQMISHDTTYDKTQWLENIGLIHKDHSSGNSSSIPGFNQGRDAEHYSLVSFNGKAVSGILVNIIGRSMVAAARQNSTPHYDKTVLLSEHAGRLLENSGVTRYADLLGRNIDRLHQAQVIIYKR